MVGGGITGLSAAYRLLHPVDARTAVPTVVLIDSAERLGGKICTSAFDGRMVDEGADAFLLRVPWARELCEELGIGAERISPAVGGASLVHRGARGPQLTSLPDGLVGGVPTRLRPLLRSPLLGPVGKLRAAADYVLPSRYTARRSAPARVEAGRADPAQVGAVSVGELVASRLGAAVASSVVDPLLGSIGAGAISRLDAATSAPILVDALAHSRSLMRGLRQLQPASPPWHRSGAAAASPAPIFGSFETGMGRLVDALTARLDDCDMRLGTPVEAIRSSGAQLAVDTGSEAGSETGSEVFTADAVVVAVPAHAAAQMLPGAPTAAAELTRIEYASVAVITLSARCEAIETPTEAGFLVTRDTGWLTTACSYGSAKWPSWSGAGAPTAVLRVSVGRDDDDRHTRLDDAALRDAVLTELSSLAPLRGLRDPGAVTAWRVSRWAQSLPQYRPGHGRLVERIDSALSRELPGVFVTGAAHRGLGIPACIRQGNEAAAAVVAHLGLDRSAGPPGALRPAHDSP